MHKPQWAGNGIQRILFVGTAPGAIPPDWLAGVSNWREDPAGRRFYPNVSETCPRVGHPFFLACSALEAAEQLHLKDSIQVTGALCRPAGGQLACSEQRREDSKPLLTCVRKPQTQYTDHPLA